MWFERYMSACQYNGSYEVVPHAIYVPQGVYWIRFERSSCFVSLGQLTQREQDWCLVHDLQKIWLNVHMLMEPTWKMRLMYPLRVSRSVLR